MLEEMKSLSEFKVSGNDFKIRVAKNTTVTLTFMSHFKDSFVWGQFHEHWFRFKNGRPV